MDSDEEITHMDVEVKELFLLPDLSHYTHLTELNCSYNYLERLPSLPETLKILKCNSNRLYTIPKLPNLKILSCCANRLEKIPKLPDSLEELYCSMNALEKIPKLPEYIIKLYCSDNDIVKLPKLPKSIQILYCSDNDIVKLPKLPDTLIELNCSNNNIYHIRLPTHLRTLNCSNNLIEHLSLNLNLQKLECSHNKITTVHLTEQLIDINLSYNRIKTMPLLPISILHINIKFTDIHDCFDINKNIEKSGYLFLYGTPLYTNVVRVLKTEEHITKPYMIKEAFQKITEIKKRFCYHYFCFKLKKRFMNWLWIIREKIAMEKYHPDKLIQLLQDNPYDILDSW